MFELKEISQEAALDCIARGEIIPELYRANSYTAVILTQSWCGQWKAMFKMLKELEGAEETPDDLTVWYLEYDKKPFFDDFMQFKESVLKNDLVPFVLYYREGELVNRSNYVSKHSFLDNLKA